MKQHTVQSGEWLNKILKSRGYTQKQIPQLLPAIQELNPQIEDLDKLQPGQVLNLPDVMPEAKPVPLPVKKAAPRERASVKPAQSTSVPPQGAGTQYVIQQGDTVTAILARHGIPAAEIFGTYLKVFQELNPGMEDVNTLHIGQQVILPDLPTTTTTSAAPAVVEAPADGENATASRSDIAAADTLPLKALSALPLPANATGAVNEASGSVPVRIPSRLLTAAMEREASQNGSIFTTPGAPIFQSKGNTPDQGMPGNATMQEPARKVVTGVPFIRTVLEKMHFHFAPGDENMYSVDRTRWLHVNLKESPIVELPWGGRAILTLRGRSDNWIADANRVGFHVCPVSSGWSPTNVMASLAETFPDSMRLWARNRNLTFSHAGLGLTLKSPCVTIIHQNGRKKIYMVWTRETDAPPLPQGLHEVLEEAGVELIELDGYNEVSRLSARPRGSVYVPVPSHLDIIRAMNPENPEALFGATLPPDLNALLTLLKSKDMLQQGMIQVEWNSGVSQHIALQVPAVTISPSARRIALLRTEDADEYVVSLLSQQGYTCFRLP